MNNLSAPVSSPPVPRCGASGPILVLSFGVHPLEQSPLPKICCQIIMGPSYTWGFPGTSGKEPTANAGDIRDAGSIPGLKTYLGEDHGKPL